MPRALEVVTVTDHLDQLPDQLHGVMCRQELQDTEKVQITIAGKDGPAVNVFFSLTLPELTIPDAPLLLIVRLREARSEDRAPQKNLRLVDGPELGGH